MIDLLDRTGVAVGWFLGHPICVRTRSIVVGSATIPGTIGEPGLDELIERWLYQHSGRWAAIVTAGRPSVYPDPFASLPILFNPATASIASSPLLLPDEDGALTDAPLVGDVAIYDTGAYFPLGATCRLGVRMLLPSHRLDVGSFDVERIWPAASIDHIDPADAVERVGGILEATISAATTTGHASMPLTAGGDSRMLLACARPVVDRIRLFTLRFRDPTGYSDARAASRIASELGLSHSVPKWVSPIEADVRDWMRLTGALTGESRGRRAGPTLAGLGSGGFNLSGVGVEVARGRKWWPTDHTTTRLSSADLFARLHLPSNPPLLRLGDRWLAEAPDLNALDVIDLFFLEICHGGWAGPLTLAHPRTFTATLYPFAHREILEIALGLSIEYRRNDRLRGDIVAARWPELNRFPVNQVPLRYRAVGRGRRAAQLPRGAVRRARQRLR